MGDCVAPSVRTFATALAIQRHNHTPKTCAVVKVLTDGATQSPMLVLVGGQGQGKSQFARWLCPLADRFIDAHVEPDNKDSLALLTTNFLWEVSELGSVTRRQDREALKAFLTRKTATYRTPYGKHPLTKPCVASFVGTSNESGILTDPTGNRRYLVAEITKIDWSYTRIDIHQVWAQVAAALRNNPNEWELLPAEVQRRDALNVDAKAELPFESALQSLFDFSDSKAWLPTAAIAERLRTNGVQFLETQNRLLADALTALGASSKRSRDKDDGGAVVRGWIGVKSNDSGVCKKG